MGRQIINNIECAKCHKMFDVATEDLEWEHADEMEADDSVSGYPETHIMQKIECPYCGKENTIVYKGIRNTDNGTYTHEVFSMELDVLLTDEDKERYNQLTRKI